MCVLFLGYRANKEFPLVLAANRDEFYERPTAPAHFWDDYPQVYAGRDLVAKGTWLGMTRTGRFAALTNFRDPKQARGKSSRGALVADFLTGSASPDEYLTDVSRDSEKFTGFNLIVGEINASSDALWYYSNRTDSPKRLDGGVYGLSNHLLDTPWPKIKKGKMKFAGLLDGDSFDREKHFELLGDKSIARDEDLPDTGIGIERERFLSAIFIETPIYGTRCSSLLTIDSDSKVELEERVFV